MKVFEESLKGVSSLEDLPEALHKHILKKCHKETYEEKGELNFLFASNNEREAEAIVGVKSRVYGWILGQKYIGQQDVVAKNVITEIWDCLSEIETTKDRQKSSLRLLPVEYKARILATRSSPEVRRILVDFISGMTDQFAIDFWNRLRTPERLRLVA